MALQWNFGGWEFSVNEITKCVSNTCYVLFIPFCKLKIAKRYKYNGKVKHQDLERINFFLPLPREIKSCIAKPVCNFCNTPNLHLLLHILFYNHDPWFWRASSLATQHCNGAKESFFLGCWFVLFCFPLYRYLLAIIHEKKKKCINKT